MQNTRRLIFAGSIFLLLLCFLFFPELEKNEDPKEEASCVRIGLEVKKADETYRIMLYKGAEERYYAFLPSGTDAGHARLIVTGAGQKLKINNSSLLLQDGDTVDNLDAHRVNTLVIYDSDGESRSGTLECVFGSDLPTMWITTRSGSMDAVDSSRDNSETGYAAVYRADGKEAYTGRLDSLSGRGNTSFDAPKKSYALSLHDAAGLLGMEEAKKWVLTANYYDGTQMRNYIGFQLAEKAGLDFTPESRFVDLYINGEYRGLYQLTERIETGPGRVDIDNGWLMEIDYPERACYEENVLYLENGQPIVIHSPERVSGVQMQLLQVWYDEMLTALYADDYTHPDTGKGIFEYLDRDSFAGMYLLEEILQDLDFGSTSHYLYRKAGQDSLLCDGPVWDLDNTLGRGFGKSREERNAFFAGSHSLSVNVMSRWYARLCGNKEFQEAVLKEWEERVCPALLQSGDEVDRLSDELFASIYMDGLRWPGEHSIFMSDADFPVNTAYLKDYLEERTDFLQKAFTENTQATLENMEWQALHLPPLEPVDVSKVPVEPQEEAAREKGTVERIMGSHGIFSFTALLVTMVLLALVDVRRNRRSR